MRPASVAIHSGSAGVDASGASAVPLYQTVSYAYATAEELADVFAGRAPGYIYTRMANPTTAALEVRLAHLEGGIGCIATASGMAAIASAVMGLVRSGDEIVAAAGIFGGTVSLFKNVLGRFGVRTRLVRAAESDEVAKALSKETKLVFVETIGNPALDVPDIRALATITRQANIPLVVDNTVATPVLIRPGQLGADIVVHSTSKFINGHGTAIGGAIVDTGNFNWSAGPFDDIRKLSAQTRQLAFLAHLRNLICRDLGGCPSPTNSHLMLQGLETLPLRMARHCANAQSLAAMLSEHPEVSWVNYPGLAGGRYVDRVLSQFGGLGGGLLTFSLGSAERAYRFIRALKLARNLANLGDAKTLVIHPASTIFHEFDSVEQSKMGVTADMIRVSVGIEDLDDIREDFQQAIEESGGV